MGSLLPDDARSILSPGAGSKLKGVSRSPAKSYKVWLEAVKQAKATQDAQLVNQASTSEPAASNCQPAAASSSAQPAVAPTTSKCPAKRASDLAAREPAASTSRRQHKSARVDDQVAFRAQLGLADSAGLFDGSLPTPRDEASQSFMPVISSAFLKSNNNRLQLPLDSLSTKAAATTLPITGALAPPALSPVVATKACPSLQPRPRPPTSTRSTLN